MGWAKSVTIPMVEEEVDMGWGKLAGRPDHGPGGHR